MAAPAPSSSQIKVYSLLGQTLHSARDSSRFTDRWRSAFLRSKLRSNLSLRVFATESLSVTLKRSFRLPKLRYVRGGRRRRRRWRRTSFYKQRAPVDSRDVDALRGRYRGSATRGAALGGRPESHRVI